ncbi:hypothetical protein KSP40_PGU008926 [Platanthera guangdongensis]|uniref:Dolichol-phosphate mannosyltransferase subunit 3 n=1 Tax=Platanthera guangdongensis TaxID=2320717 RepID=A0ABR2MSC1_9ASPA
MSNGGELRKHALVQRQWQEVLGLQVNLEETYYLAFYGAGALLALWISSAVVSSIDSIPLENRAELFSKIEDLKERIIGQSDGE